MLCEVETAILNLGLDMPSTHTAVIVTESSNWAKEGDLTLMLIQDWGVLRLYQAFLNDWTRAFRNATATGPGTCDPTLLRPLTLRPKSPKKVTSSSQIKGNRGKTKRPGVGKFTNKHQHQKTMRGQSRNNYARARKVAGMARVKQKLARF